MCQLVATVCPGLQHSIRYQNMAIIPELPGLSVEIVLKNNEEALVEYHNEDDIEPNNARYTTQNFIEAKTGAAFGIRCRRASNETLDEVLGTYSVAMLIYVGDDCLDDIVEDPSDPIGVTSWGSPSGPAGRSRVSTHFAPSCSASKTWPNTRTSLLIGTLR